MFKILLSSQTGCVRLNSVIFPNWSTRTPSNLQRREPCSRRDVPTEKGDSSVPNPTLVCHEAHLQPTSVSPLSRGHSLRPRPSPRVANRIPIHVRLALNFSRSSALVQVSPGLCDWSKARTLFASTRSVLGLRLSHLARGLAPSDQLAKGS